MSNVECRMSKESFEFRISNFEFVSDFGFRISDLSEPDWRFDLRAMFSRMAINFISGVMMPWRAYQSCVTGWPAEARKGRRAQRSRPTSPFVPFDVRRSVFA